MTLGADTPVAETPDASAPASAPSRESATSSADDIRAIGLAVMAIALLLVGIGVAYGFAVFSDTGVFLYSHASTVTGTIMGEPPTWMGAAGCAIGVALLAESVRRRRAEKP